MRLGAAVAVCVVLFSVPAFAAMDMLNVKPGAKPEAPPSQMPPMPTPEPAPQPAQVVIPALPPSLPCKTEWLQGLWLLQRVYEAPPGKETESYNANPVQYIGFDKDSRFYRYNGGRAELDPETVYKQITEHSGALLQYLLQDAGMLYLYRDSVATETSVCFIVAETKPPYGAGNLLLMPPKGQITGRLIKVYKKVWPPKAPPPAEPQHAGTVRHIVRH